MLKRQSECTGLGAAVEASGLGVFPKFCKGCGY